VTVVSTSRLPIVAEMSRARWPSSPTARTCGCLHRGSNVQAVSKTGEAALSHVPMASASCIALRQARLGGRGVGQVRVQISHSRTRPRARARAPCAAASRAQRQGGPRLGHMRGGRPGWGTPVDGGLVSLGSEEDGDDVGHGVDRLARILVCRGASIVMCALGGWCACGVECAVAGLSC